MRGNIFFTHRHVAIVRDAGSLIHANAFHMAVALEPIEAAIARIRAAGSEVTSVRRLDPGQLTGAKSLLDLLLEPPNEQHLTQELAQPLLGQRTAFLDLRHSV